MVNLADLEGVYVERLAAFRRVATAITGDRDAGFDAVQEAFAVAVRKRGRFRGDGSLESWVWKIVVNSARSSRRASGRRMRREREAQARFDTSSESSDVPLDVLTNRQREVVFLRYFADLSYAEIGEVLGVAEGTVGATLNTALGALRRAMQEATA